MRVIRVKKKTMSKTILIAVGIASVVVLITGAVLFNPICLGAGAAGLFLSCGMAVGLKKPQQAYMA